ncbi:hypothetical protein [Actinomadura rugatobispora]|uniref:DUF1349 domain-containing protein n=1 Tax=Actinomadura rugatobispora TaxID=1994 RepID=A0ABW0ZTH8_9ACTN|nr:hypothetical protein GCM10010200_009290 [Actinomadura rugatobispora]
MQATDKTTAVLRREWAGFRTRGRLIAIAAVPLTVILVGLLYAFGFSAGTCSEGPVEVPCPTDPVGPDGQGVSDTFSFVHRPLGEQGSITVRLTSMKGIITYPPPDHDEIVEGLVPWAKAGIIIKDGLSQGSSYAALMVTGSHGVRMQHDYVHDVAGSPRGVSAGEPRWLRLTRSRDTITGSESADGVRWTKVGTARLPGLPATVQVGLFAASPGDLTLVRTALGASLPESRFTQATAAFDSIALDGAPVAGWSSRSIGRQGETDWERFHRAPGLVESNGTFTLTGSGDIGPVPEGGGPGGPSMSSTLIGVPIGAVIALVVAAQFGASGGRALAARATVIGGTAFVAGLVAAGPVVLAAPAIIRSRGVSVAAVPALTELRVVLGVAALLAGAAVLALSLGALLRRARAAIPIAVSAVVLPYLLATLPLFPDEVARWLLRVTPAAAFAVQQTVHEYPQVTALYAPSGGYFPLPWWAGLAVLCGYAVAALALALSAAPAPPSAAAGPAAPEATRRGGPSAPSRPGRSGSG